MARPDRSPIGSHRTRGGSCARLTVLLITWSLPLGACSSSQLGAYQPLDGRAPGGVSLIVTNGHVQDMRIYLLRGATRIPLGSLSTGERRAFALPTAMIGHTGVIRLGADPLGSRDMYESELIPVGLGEQVEWRLAPSLGLSSYSVRPMRRF